MPDKTHGRFLRDQYRYRVASTRIVSPSDVEELDPPGTEILTLLFVVLRRGRSGEIHRSCREDHLKRPGPKGGIIKATWN
jgi:hypothetical protein